VVPHSEHNRHYANINDPDVHGPIFASSPAAWLIPVACCSSQRFPPLPGRNSTIRGRQLCHPMNLGSLYCLEVGALQKCLPNRCAGLSACIGAGAVSGLAGLAAHSWGCSFPVKALRSIYPANGTANLRHLGLDIAADLKLAALRFHLDGVNHLYGFRSNRTICNERTTASNQQHRRSRPDTPDYSA